MAFVLAAALATTGCAGLAGGAVVTEQVETGERTVERVEDAVTDIDADSDARQSELDAVTDEAD